MKPLAFLAAVLLAWVLCVGGRSAEPVRMAKPTVLAVESIEWREARAPFGPQLRVHMTASPDDFDGNVPNGLCIIVLSAIHGWDLVTVREPSYPDYWGYAREWDGFWHMPDEPDPLPPLRLVLIFEKFDRVISKERNRYHHGRAVSPGLPLDRIKELLTVRVEGGYFSERRRAESRFDRAVNSTIPGPSWSRWTNGSRCVDFNPSKGLEIELWPDLKNAEDVRSQIETLAEQYGVKLESFTVGKRPYYVTSREHGGDAEVPLRTKEKSQ